MCDPLWACKGGMNSDAFAAKSRQVAPPPVVPNHRTWLFCIPVQVGPATPYVRSSTSWFLLIVVLQAITDVLRFIILMDIIGGLWMMVVVAAGIYTYYHNMNISYVCTWGVLCAINFVFDVISQAIPALLGALSFQLLPLVVRIAIPVVYLLGVFFAWHAYHDYEEAQGHQTITAYDPMGKFFDRYDPSAHVPLMKSSLPGPGGPWPYAAEGPSSAPAGGFMERFPGRPQQDDYQGPPSAPAAGYAAWFFGQQDTHRLAGEAQYEDTHRRAGEAYGALAVGGDRLAGTAREGHGHAQDASRGFLGAFAQGR